MNYKENYEMWLNDDYFDEDTKKQLQEISNDEKEIEERVYKNLEFGTGGLRGMLGAGTNRMNIYTVSKATQGLANYLLKQEDCDAKAMGVAIAYDSRRMSPEFANQAALVMNGNGIKAYVFDELRPTPELSFAVRKLGCIAGIVITASHNPPEYNGYKAYWSDGAQIPYPKDEIIIDEVNLVTDFRDIKVAVKEEAAKAGLYNVIGKEIDDEFIENVKAQSVNSDAIRQVADDFKIVYTPLHGTGNKPVRRILEEIGFKHVHVVKEQELPDPDFTTVSYPNPEDPKAFELALKLADQLKADIVVGTDPDCDRVGAVVKNSEGEYVILTGNMTGVLLTEYLLSQKQKNGTLPKNGAVISTIVSTNMTKKIAESYGLAYFDVLTGFKYIGEKIKQFDADKSHEYVFGFEESYGCLAGTYARDKDAVVASMLICEMAAYYKTRGMSLYEGLQEVYAKYGFYKETIQSISLKGLEGAQNIKRIMSSLRTEPISELDGVKVAEFRDYMTGIDNLPKSDVLYYVLEDDSWFCVRPSGTEPKIKIYFGTSGESIDHSSAKNDKLVEATMEIVNSRY